VSTILICAKTALKILVILIKGGDDQKLMRGRTTEDIEDKMLDKSKENFKDNERGVTGISPILKASGYPWQGYGSGWSGWSGQVRLG